MLDFFLNMVVVWILTTHKQYIKKRLHNGYNYKFNNRRIIIRIRPKIRLNTINNQIKLSEVNGHEQH